MHNTMCTVMQNILWDPLIKIEILKDLNKFYFSWICANFGYQACVLNSSLDILLHIGKKVEKSFFKKLTKKKL